MAKLERKHILQILLVVLAILLAVGAVVATGVNNIDFVDSDDYLAAAKMMVEQGSYPTVGIKLPFFRAPGYPMFIALIWMVFPGSIIAIKAVQVILHGITCWLVFRIAFTITKNEFLSFLGGLIFAINPLLLYNTAGIQTEGPHTFLMTWLLFILVRSIMSDEVRIKDALLSGVLLGLGCLIKPSAIGIGAVLVAAFFLLQYRKKGIFAATAAIPIAMILMILPWSFYNLQTKGEFMLINDSAGFALWLGNHPDWIPIFEGRFATAEEAAAHEEGIVTKRKEQIAEWEATVGYSSLTYTQRDKLWRQKAIEMMMADPGATLKLFALKLYLFWKPFTNPFSFSLGKTILSGLATVPIYLFGILGIFNVRKTEKGKKVVWLFLMLAAGASLLHMLIISTVRYRLPYIDPFLIVFAGIGFGGLLLRFASKIKFAGFLNNDTNLAAGV
ncbi:MAG TPA: glycosyltransferase family 39 protein [Pyrinomonadaceae bacterium]|nr:glycosyltransferase family 39 protein [Pyrinomonadaceae bacterium]